MADEVGGVQVGVEGPRGGGAGAASAGPRERRVVRGEGHPVRGLVGGAGGEEVRVLELLVAVAPDGAVGGAVDAVDDAGAGVGVHEALEGGVCAAAVEELEEG